MQDLNDGLKRLSQHGLVHVDVAPGIVDFVTDQKWLGKL